MRERILKAKRKANGEWEEGFYFYMSHNDEKRDHLHHFIMPLGTDISKGTPLENIQVEIYPETICSDIGKTDKNKTKLWENDIVQIDGEDEYFIVAWEEETARYVLEGCTVVFDFDSLDGNDMEVIGNTFDNPELVE